MSNEKLCCWNFWSNQILISTNLNQFLLILVKCFSLHRIYSFLTEINLTRNIEIHNSLFVENFAISDCIQNLFINFIKNFNFLIGNSCWWFMQIFATISCAYDVNGLSFCQHRYRIQNNRIINKIRLTNESTSLALAIKHFNLCCILTY